MEQFDELERHVQRNWNKIIVENEERDERCKNFITGEFLREVVPISFFFVFFFNQDQQVPEDEKRS